MEIKIQGDDTEVTASHPRIQTPMNSPAIDNTHRMLVILTRRSTSANVTPDDFFIFYSFAHEGLSLRTKPARRVLKNKE
jgi:PHD/YefM family antitoxin component YafN of YafNO toxin-antitoxin module